METQNNKIQNTNIINTENENENKDKNKDTIISNNLSKLTPELYNALLKKYLEEENEDDIDILLES
jgi:hypothetical protein